MSAPVSVEARENRIRFGHFSLDLRSGELIRAGRPVDLAALPARLLRYLAANRGRVVAKSELVREIWETPNVSEATLQQAIRAARRAVGDDGRAQRVIATASRVGYRFVAAVEGDDARAVAKSGLAFVGRRALLAVCEEGLDDLDAGRGGLLFLSGAAGIGKSRLLDEIERLASRRALLVVRGGELLSEGAGPFWPWVDAFVSLSRLRPLAELRSRAPHLLGLEADARGPIAEWARFGHFEAAANCLRRAAEVQPLVLCLEDMAEASPYAWELLEYVVSKALRSRLLLVATLRTNESQDEEMQHHRLARIRSLPRVRELEVDVLSQVESAYLVELASGRPLPAEHVAAIAGGTGGNPLAAIELARLLATATDLLDETQWQGFVGQSVQRMLAIRIARLPAWARANLVTASVLGTTFEGDVLGRALPGEEPWRAIEVAIEANLIAPISTHTGVYRFAHDLVRDAFNAELADEPERRREIHLGIADAIVGDDSSRRSALAHHLCAAGELAGAERIAVATEEAARDATRGGEIDGAFDLYERALRVLGEIDSQESETFCAMLVTGGEIGVRGARLEAARARLDQAIELARALGRADLFARASLARAYRTEIVGTADRELLDLLDEAVAGLGETAPSLVAQLRSRASIELRYAPDGERRALSLIEEAIEGADRSGDLHAVARVHEDASLVRWSVADPAGWLELNAAIADAAQEVGDTELVFQGYKGLATSQLELGRRDEFDREVDRCAATAEDYPSPFLLSVVSGMRASQAFLDGDFVKAEENVLAAASRGLEDLAPLCAAQIFYHRLETGRSAELEAATRQFALGSPGIATWQVALARLLVDQGRYEEAQETLAGIGPLDAVVRDRNWFPAMAMFAECVSILQDRAGAERVFEQIEPYAKVGVVLGNATIFYGAGAYYLGMLANCLGRLDQARTYLEQARDMHDGLRSETWRLWTQLEQARGLGKGGSLSEARALAGRIAKAANALGMVRCARAAEEMSLASND